jgi:hypothetical protein
MADSIPLKPISSKTIFIPGGEDNIDSDVERFVEDRKQSATPSIIDKPAAKPKAAPKKRAAAKPKPIVRNPPAPPQEDDENSEIEPPTASIPGPPSKSVPQYDSFSEEDDQSESEYEIPQRRSYPRVFDDDIPAQAPPPAPPVVVAKTISEIQPEILDRNTVIQKIILYRQTFPAKFGKPMMTKLKKVEIGCKTSDAELRAILDECKLAIGSTASNALLLPLFTAGMTVYESIAIRVGIRINGITKLMSEDPGINQIIQEIGIEYLNISYIKPEYRLLLAVLQTSFVLHRANMIMMERSQLSNAPPPAPQKPPQPDRPPDKDSVIIVERRDNVPDADIPESFQAKQQKYATL